MALPALMGCFGSVPLFLPVQSSACIGLFCCPCSFSQWMMWCLWSCLWLCAAGAGEAVGDEEFKKEVRSTLALIHQSLVDTKSTLNTFLESTENELNCWDRKSFLSTKSKRGKDFPDAVMSWYGSAAAGGVAPARRKCQVMGDKGHDVIGAHLYKSATNGLHLEKIGIAPQDVNCGRNGLMLSKGIEDAFDHLLVCFLYNKTSKTLHLYVADENLKSKPVHGDKKGITFADINGWELQCGGDSKSKRLPFRRVLGLHAYYTLKKHKLLGTKAVVPADGSTPTPTLTWKYFRRSRASKTHMPEFLRLQMEEDAVHEMMAVSDEEKSDG